MIWPVKLFSITTSSMRPCFREKDVALAISMKVATPLKRGDIVFFKRKDLLLVDQEVKNKEDFRVKRVIAMPGEFLMIKEGKVHIDGKKITDFVKGKWDIPDYGRKYIPLGKYFLMGDNRGNSIDSRDYNSVLLKDIFYKAHVVFFPPWHFKILKFW